MIGGTSEEEGEEDNEANSMGRKFLFSEGVG